MATAQPPAALKWVFKCHNVKTERNHKAKKVIGLPLVAQLAQTTERLSLATRWSQMSIFAGAKWSFLYGAEFSYP